MTALIWDQAGTRYYERGVERGVLYLEDGSGIPWSGLISVNENSPSNGGTSIYFDGVKYGDLLELNDFSGSLKAYTYPDEFLDFEGILEVGNGLFVSNQQPKRFNLSYRTRIDSDEENQGTMYKIHILYNLLAVPVSKMYQTLSDNSTPIEFEWTITAIPSEVSGFRPTAHVVFDTREMEPRLLSDIETTLYGDAFNDAKLPPISTLVSFVGGWVIIRITDNLDGTWTAEGPDDLISMLDSTTFQIIQANAVYLDANTYMISNLTH